MANQRTLDSDSDAEGEHSEQPEESEHSVSEDEQSDQSEDSSTTLNQPASAIEDKEEESDEDMDEVPAEDEEAVEQVNAPDAEPAAVQAEPVSTVDIAPDDALYAEYINDFDVSTETPDIEDNVPSAEYAVPSTEYTAPSAEYIPPSAGNIVPSAEYITPSAENIVSNADYDNAAFDMAESSEPIAPDFSEPAVQEDDQAAVEQTVPDALLQIPSIFDLLSLPSPDETSTPSASGAWLELFHDQ